MIDVVQKINKWLNNQPGWIRLALFPSLLAGISFLIQNYKGEAGSIVHYAIVSGYFLLLMLIALLNYENTNFINRTNSEIEILNATIAMLNQYVKDKNTKLVTPYEDGKTRSRVQAARSVRSHIKFYSSVSSINSLLMKTLHLYLKRRHGGICGNIYLAFLVPSANGYFERFGEPQQSESTNRGALERRLMRVDDTDTMIGQLHADSSTISRCSGDTSKSAEATQFKYFSESERDIIKSIFCYKVVNPTSEAVVGYWIIESDEIGILPDPEQKEFVKELRYIFYHFAIRLIMESNYDRILNDLDPLLERISKMHLSDNNVSNHDGVRSRLS